jgi:hypothetical protein
MALDALRRFADETKTCKAKICDANIFRLAVVGNCADAAPSLMNREPPSFVHTR